MYDLLAFWLTEAVRQGQMRVRPTHWQSADAGLLGSRRGLRRRPLGEELRCPRPDTWRRAASPRGADTGTCLTCIVGLSRQRQNPVPATPDMPYLSIPQESAFRRVRRLTWRNNAHVMSRHRFSDAAGVGPATQRISRRPLLRCPYSGGVVWRRTSVAGSDLAYGASRHRLRHVYIGGERLRRGSRHPLSAALTSTRSGGEPVLSAPMSMIHVTRVLSRHGCR